MNKICTSINQSQRLVGLGIDVNTADMSYCPIMNIDSGKNEGYLEVPECYPFSEVKDYLVPYLPAWSLTALLELMPDVININGINYRQQEFKTKNSYCYCYADERFPISFDGQPVDVAFEMVVWLLENKKL